jgi:hypothetical protein
MKIIGKELPLAQRLAIMQRIKSEIMTWSLDKSGINAGFTTPFPCRRGYQGHSRWSKAILSRSVCRQRIAFPIPRQIKALASSVTMTGQQYATVGLT